MSYFCPECGAEVTDGNQCEECGHVDETCASCGTTLGTDAWLCSDCDTLRETCPECGHGLGADGCPECGAKRPAVCESCGDVVERGTKECPSCRHNPEGTTRSRARLVKYAGVLIPTVLIVVAIGSQLGDSRPDLVGMVVTVPLMYGFWGLPALFLSRRWRKKAESKTIDTVPS